MLDFVTARLGHAEELAQRGADLVEVLRWLRALDMDNFAVLLESIPDGRWPALSALLPTTVPVETQRHLTGDSGRSLLSKSIRFVRTVEHHYVRHTGRPLANQRILDFGFGYGRLARLMLKFTDPENLYGCDPAPRSLDWATAHQLPGHFATSQSVLGELPFTGVAFNLIYAFSVFTHLSREATSAAIRVLSQALQSDGLLVVTIRPADYWNNHAKLQDEERLALTAEHRHSGFSFSPMTSSYGDTTISLEWIRAEFPAIDIVGYDWSLGDPQQIVVLLRPNWRARR
jgi:SAM-dependent methyltransferase